MKTRAVRYLEQSKNAVMSTSSLQKGLLVISAVYTGYPVNCLFQHRKTALEPGGAYGGGGGEGGDHTYIHACVHACMHTSIQAYMHTCIHAYMHTCIHAYMHTCIHAYIHTYM